MAGTLYTPRGKSFWLLVRRLLCRKKHRPPATAAEEDGDKSSLLGRSSTLEELLGSDGGAAVDCRCASRNCAKRHGQPVQLPGRQRPDLARPEATAVSAPAGDDRGGAAVQYRRFMFGGFRRRLLMRRPWRPMLVAIPE